jgi:protein phosphatase 1G
MEDATVFQELADGVYLFGVFDGHGGPEVAHFVAKVLPKEIINDSNFKLKNYSKALTSVFKKVDEMVVSSRGEEELNVISKRLGVTGTSNGEKIAYRAGSTAIVMIMTKNRYYVANIGDSRAVLSRSHTAVPLSTDHKPDLLVEKTRI